jgi:hypothetical protein
VDNFSNVYPERNTCLGKVASQPLIKTDAAIDESRRLPEIQRCSGGKDKVRRWLVGNEPPQSPSGPVMIE